MEKRLVTVGELIVTSESQEFRQLTYDKARKDYSFNQIEETILLATEKYSEPMVCQDCGNSFDGLKHIPCPLCNGRDTEFESDLWEDMVEPTEEANKEMVNTTTIKVPKKYQSMLELVEADGDGYWAYSKEGYYFQGMGAKTAHEDTQKELLSMIRTLKEE